MKKVITLILVFVLCVSICACSSEEKIKADLTDGSWVQESTWETGRSRRTYTFSYDGSFSDYFTRLDMELSFNRTGTYVIEQGRIILCYDDQASDEYIYYENSNGKLALHRVVDGEKIPLDHK